MIIAIYAMRLRFLALASIAWQCPWVTALACGRAGLLVSRVLGLRKSAIILLTNKGFLNSQ
jgi:hypothetical protein